MIGTFIKDGGGQGHSVRVTSYGQLVTAPVAYSQASSQKLEVDDTAYNLASPEASNLIVITDILLYANKSVSATTEAIVTIYESSVGPSEADVTTTLLQTEMLKQSSRDITGLNLVTTEGTWINAKTSDDDVFVTIMFYYLPISIRNV